MIDFGFLATAPSDEITISRTQRNVHVLAETLALFVAAPLTVYIAHTATGLASWQRDFLWALATGTVLVDGYLLHKYLGQT